MTISDDDDMLAGEFVLGTLDRDARSAAATRRVSEPEFNDAVVGWENRLVPLDEASTGVEPPANLWVAILARISALGDAAPARSVQSNVIYLGRQLRLWRQIAAASMAIAAVLALWVGANYVGSPPKAGQTLIAVLQQADQQPAFLMKADLSDRQMSVRAVAAPDVPGKSYELWIIDPVIGPPKSLGVLGGAVTVGQVLPDVSQDVLARATYAVTIEPQGGSPSGAPTTKPVFLGHLLRTDP